MADFSGMNELEGLQFIPINDKKVPTVKDWQTKITKHDLSNTYGVGLVCGSPSGFVEGIDFDMKYSLDGKMFDRFKKLVNEYDKDLLRKMVVATTKNKGFHLIYRCQKIGGNEKLANRLATEKEKQDTYNESYQASIQKSISEEDAKKKAEKEKTNDKVRVLIETRGIGGYLAIAPTPGYDFKFGDLTSVSEITPTERDFLIGLARQFNEVFEEYKPPKTFQEKTKGLSAGDDYNRRGDIIQLLQNHGWKYVNSKGNKIHFQRPGQTDAATSGNYDTERGWFTVFSTSTEFDSQKAYSPFAVYSVLECNKDFSEAAKRLYAAGYGERDEPKEKPKSESTRIITSRVNIEDGDLSFLAKNSDYDGYLKQVIDGTLPMGLTTGCPSLDEFFLFKEGNVVINNGVDNTGKTVFSWWILLIAAMYHGWGGVIYASENTLGGFMRKMIQFYWGQPIRGINAMNDTQYQIAKKFIESHFLLIKAEQELFNYKDLINMTIKIRKAEKENKKSHPSLAKITVPLKYLMIDPYNSLKMNLSGFSKLSSHEYHYEAISEIKSYGQQTNWGFWINMHAVTSAARAKDGEKKYAVAPRKEDTEGGVKFQNKADDFLTTHRLANHPDRWRITELHVRKIKDTETGGRQTPLEQPVLFENYSNGCAFKEFLDGVDIRPPVDPIHQWRIQNEPYQSEIFVNNQANLFIGPSGLKSLDDNEAF